MPKRHTVPFAGQSLTDLMQVIPACAIAMVISSLSMRYNCSSLGLPAAILSYCSIRPKKTKSALQKSALSAYSLERRSLSNDNGNSDLRAARLRAATCVSSSRAINIVKHDPRQTPPRKAADIFGTVDARCGHLAETAFMKRSRITTGSIVITGSLMLPLSHLHTITVIFLLSIAPCNTGPRSLSCTSITFSQPQALATAVKEVFLPA